MDYLGEVIALGIDSIIFGVCLKQYFHCKNAITAVKVKLYIIIKFIYIIFNNNLVPNLFLYAKYNTY